MLNGACGPFAPFLRMNLPTKLANSLQGDFLRVVAGDRPAKSRKWLCRAPNRCGVLCGQMAKVELPETVRKVPEAPKERGLTGHQTALFGLFCPRYTGQIHARSSTQTPFRTVSPRTSVNRGKKG